MARTRRRLDPSRVVGHPGAPSETRAEAFDHPASGAPALPPLRRGLFYAFSRALVLRPVSGGCRKIVENSPLPHASRARQRHIRGSVLAAKAPIAAITNPSKCGTGKIAKYGDKSFYGA